MPEAGVESAMPFQDAGAGVTGAAKPAHAATMVDGRRRDHHGLGLGLHARVEALMKIISKIIKVLIRIWGSLRSSNHN